MLAQVFLALLLVASSWGAEIDARLYNFIASSADSRVRPVRDSAAPLNLTFGFWLFNIHKLDVNDQSFEIIGAMNQTWKDEYVSWNPEDYGGSNKFPVEKEVLWTPTMALIPGHYPREELQISILSDGTVNRGSMSKFNTKCRVSPTSTTASCKLMFMPWAHDASEINLIAKPIIKAPGFFMENHDWLVDSLETKKNVNEYPCCPGVKFGDITYTINLKKVV